MRLLLDTHTFLWWSANDPQLSGAARGAIASGDNDVYVSAVNGWEISIKARLGKLPLPEEPAKFMTRLMSRHGFAALPITLAHAVHEFGLPPHHADPFDRLLVAQAQLEDLVLVTNDPVVGRYAIETLW